MIALKCGVLLVFLTFSFCNGHTFPESKKFPKIPRIAIIGGGIGGSVTAWKLYLSYIHMKSVDLYEAAEIGGRLATVEVNGRHFEVGGSTIHSSNYHMRHYVHESGLKFYEEPSDHRKSDTYGLYNGEEFVFITSEWSVWNLSRLFYRYGFDVTSFEKNVVLPMRDAVERLYEAQKAGKYFSNVHQLLDYMSEEYPRQMTMELKHYFTSNGYSQSFVDEVVFAATNANYNQNTNIHQFVGSVALANRQDPGSLLRVVGGFKLVAENLISNAWTNVINARVDSITLTENQTFALAVNNATQIYDYVVIAFPIIDNSENRIQFFGFPNLKIPRIQYRKTVVTLVHGELNHTFFHYDSPEELPDEIYSVNDKLFYDSISVSNPVKFDPNYDRKVFKVVSKDVLTDEQLHLLFLTRHSVKVVPWLAYPLYDTRVRDLPFELYDNLFYVNSIEWAASAMETSAISAVNIVHMLEEKILEWEINKLKISDYLKDFRSNSSV